MTDNFLIKVACVVVLAVVAAIVVSVSRGLVSVVAVEASKLAFLLIVLLFLSLFLQASVSLHCEPMCRGRAVAALVVVAAVVRVS